MRKRIDSSRSDLVSLKSRGVKPQLRSFDSFGLATPLSSPGLTLRVSPWRIGGFASSSFDEFALVTSGNMHA